MSTQRVRYHQMLVSPHVGGGAKLAMEIHGYAEATRGGVSHLLIPGGGEAERAAQSRNFSYTKYGLDRLMSSSRFGAAWESVALAARMLRHGRGVLHVHSPFVYGAARAFFRLSRLKTVLHVHLDFTAEQLRWSLTTPPDLIVLCAEYMRPAVNEALSPRAQARTRVVSMRNAVDIERFRGADKAAAKSRLGVPDDVKLLMVIANLAPHKGQETAIRAMRRLRDAGHSTKLMIVGGERADAQGYLPYLQRLTADLELGGDVQFLGFRNDVPELLAAADFLLLPSTSEGLPLVMLEAQASKAIVLAAPTAGIPEVIEDGVTGLLIPAQDHDRYAQAIDRLLMDQQLAGAIRERAFAYVLENHDMGNYCRRMLEQYDSLLS